MIELIENKLDTGTYLELRDSVKWKKLTYSQAEEALKNSLFMVCAYDETGNPVGMGRMVGDGVVIVYIQDLIVRPGVQKCGVGRMIIERLIEYAESIRKENTELMLCLMCAKGREDFYKKFNFTARPTDTLGPGMIQYLK